MEYLLPTVSILDKRDAAVRPDGGIPFLHAIFVVRDFAPPRFRSGHAYSAFFAGFPDVLCGTSRLTGCAMQGFPRRGSWRRQATDEVLAVKSLFGFIPSGG